MVGAALIALAIMMFAPAAASAWAPAAQATVHPGVMTFTDGGQCTSNFVFTQGSDVYLGQAAHCSGTGGATETNGCDSGSLPVGTPVEIDGASRPGTMVYNSWLTMQARGETNPDACEYNDFALVRVDPADVGNVNPSVPGFGGPTGSARQPTARRSTPTATRRCAEESPSSAPSRGWWSRPRATAGAAPSTPRAPESPGTPGSGFLNSAGQAFGVLSTLQILPTAGSNGVGDLSNELDYMRANSSQSSTQLAPGTEPFKADIAAAIIGS